MNFNKYLKCIPVLAIFLIALSAGFILYYILSYGVDIPYMDQWEYVSFFDHLSKGTLTFNELFKLQCEYRQLFPNLIFVSLGWLTNWNVRYEMIVTFLLACLVFFNIYRLATLTANVESWKKWIMLFLASLFIFSPLQYENWLFGVQIEYFMPIACVTSCMVIAFTGIKAIFKLIFCMMLAVISTYSSVNGFLCWIVLLPVFYLSDTDRGFFKKWPVIATWIIGTILSLIFYFIDYKKPKGFPSTYEALDHPLEAIKYIFGILGNPIRIVHSLEHIIIVGGIILLVFIALVIYIVWHSKDKQLIRNSIVWLMLGLYSIMTAGMIMFGRLGFGVFQSLTSRYTTYTLYLVVAIIFLFSIVVKHYANRVRLSFIYKAAIVFLVVYIIYIKVDTFPVAVNDLKNFHASVQHGKAGLLLINYISHDECTNKIYPYSFKELKKRARTLDSLGYLRPGLIKTNVLQDIEGEGSGTIDYGSFDKLTQLDDSLYTASGFAKIPKTKSPVDAVLLSFENYTGKSVLFTMDNADSLNWKKTFSMDYLPFNPIILKAWAFDANTGKAYRLKGRFVVER